MESRTYTMDARAEAVEATRRRIIESADRLFEEHWWDEVTLARIATGAGVSHQTVLNHFGSKDGVLTALIAHKLGDTIERRETVEPGDTAAAVRRLLDQYEQAGLINARAVQQEHRVPALKAALDEGRAQHRAWIERTFAHALPASEPERRQRVAAFLGATEVAMWNSLHHGYGYSRKDAAAALTTLVNALEKLS
jgi:AcrR family transcriptional regulator